MGILFIPILLKWNVRGLALADCPCSRWALGSVVNNTGKHVSTGPGVCRLVTHTARPWQTQLLPGGRRTSWSHPQPGRPRGLAATPAPSQHSYFKLLGPHQPTKLRWVTRRAHAQHRPHGNPRRQQVDTVAFNRGQGLQTPFWWQECGLTVRRRALWCAL